MLELRRRYGAVNGGQPSRLPAGYKEVEWITMPKGGYISSGVNAKGTLRVYTKFAIRELEVAWIFGSRKGEYDSNFGVLNHTSNNFIRPAYGNDYINISNSNIKDTNIHVIDMAYGSCKLDGVTLHNFGQKEFEGIDMLIGAFRNNNVIDATAAHDFYEFTIWENSVEIRNFVPCINPSGKAGMYDLVGKKFYGNAGTGEFLAGAVVGKPILPKEYQEVEYLESTGTQYLIIPFENVKHTDVVRYKFMYFSSQIQQEAHIYGTDFLNGYYTTITRYSQDGGWFRWYTYQSYHDNIPFELDTIVSEEIKYPNVISNGTTYKLGAISSETLYSNYFVLFGAMYNGTINAPMKGRFYYFEVEGKVKLIPCRRLKDNVKGMYDIVNDVFYTNVGTGEFLVGADVGGGNTDIEYLTAIEVTGGSIITDWIPQAGAVVKWDCMIMDGLTGVIADQRYFDTIPDRDSIGRVFDSNNNGALGSSVFVWIDYKLGYGALSPYDAPNMLLNTRHTYIWDGLNGQAGYDGNMKKLGNKRTTSSGYPLRLFCGRTSSRMIIYGIELINQENEGGQTYTLRPARKEGIIGLYCEETGVFWSSDDGAEFTIYEE